MQFARLRGIAETCGLGWDSSVSEWKAVVSLEEARAELEDLEAAMSQGLRSCGYVIVSLGSAMSQDPQWAATAATILVSLMGEPIGVFRNIDGYWRALTVDLSRPPDRSCGAGYQPVHHDFVNASRPPDIVSMYCRRADPLGGGQSLVTVLDGLDEHLAPATKALLAQPRFRDGAVTDLDNVGHDINPFAVLDDPRGNFHFRFTGKLLASCQFEDERAAVENIMKYLDDHTTVHALQPGDLLLLDQRRAVHGRLPMAGAQDELAPDQRRLLMLSFANWYDQ